MVAADNWFTPLWTTVAGGVIVVLCQQTWKFVRAWQERRETVDETDHKLLHEMAAVMMDTPPGVFSKGSPGLLTRFNSLESDVGDIKSAVGKILEKVQ